jgi:hypothetical protein
MREVITAPRQLVSFIWAGQDGLAEVAYEYSQRRHMPVDQALITLGEYRVFAPMLRHRDGSTKADVTPLGNVLWADVDRRDAPESFKEFTQVTGVIPSAVIDSGNKGFWMYLKLDHLIPKAEVERMNSGLAWLLDADHSGNVDRLARLPGSINQNSGRRAEVTEFTAVLHDPTVLGFLSAAATEPSNSPETDFLDEGPRGLVHFPAMAKLSEPLWMYIRRHPRWGEGYDRSEEEHKIIVALCGQGWSDEEIIAFADAYRLPRHRQERMKNGNYSWTERSITRGRTWIENHPSLSTDSHMCRRGCTYTHADVHQVLSLFEEPLRSYEAVERIKSLGLSTRTARYKIEQFVQAGYLIKHRQGRNVTICLAEKGQYALSLWYRPLIALPAIRSL